MKASRGELVVADTRAQVGRINHAAHRLRVVTGQAADSVVTAAGEQIGLGDTIATRQNDAEVGVANREMWTVIDSSAAGLHVKGENGKRVLPPTYVTTMSNSRTRPRRTAPTAEVFGRDRADLGPSHARGLAVEAIDRYGPMQARCTRRTSAPKRRPEPDITYRPPAPSAPSLGL